MATPSTATPTPASNAAATTPASTTATPAANPTSTTAANAQFSSTSLYVGDLANDVNETHLFEIFNSVGPVASIRVCRDAVTRRSLGYAYINFHNGADADKALDILNNQPIKGKPCRIMWSQRDPSVRKSGKGNIFIKNLDKSIDHKSLFDTFSTFGAIVSCKIELDENNQSKGYGYIQFATQEEADFACTKVNGKMMAGKKVFVGPFVSRKERNMSNGAKKFTNIYVNNLAENVDDEKLKEMFKNYGVIKSALVMKDDSSSKSKGFAFINFENADDAQRAVEELNGKEFEGKTVFVGRAQKKAERESELRQKFELMKMEHMAKYQGVNLYVKNLDDDFDDQKFIQVFSPFGTITSARVMFDADKRSKGFGFVCYSTPDEATKAVTEMNGKIVGSKPLYVALAQRKDVRKMQLEAQFASRTKGVQPRMPGMGPIYNGAPMFFAAQPGAPGQPPFVYGGPNMVARGRFPATPGPYQGMPNYMVVNTPGGRGQPPMKGAMGRGGQPSRGRGMKHPNNQHTGQHNANATQAPAQAPIEPVVAMGGGQAASTEEQKRLLGEKLYPLIHKSQPSLAGKITGMILESSYVEEIVSLLESNEALNDKIEEAVKVLREHNEKQQQ